MCPVVCADFVAEAGLEPVQLLAPGLLCFPPRGAEHIYGLNCSVWGLGRT